eukprot:gene12187-25590_t
MSLTSLCFFTLNRHRPGIFVASYLLMHGWNEKDIGIVMFFEGLTCLVFQTPIGQMVDCTSHKKQMVAWIGIALGFPAIYGITLGLVGHEGIMNQVPINEMATHAGNAFYAGAACGLALYARGDGLFWFTAVMGLGSCISLLFIDEKSIDHDKARGLDRSTSSSNKEPIPLKDFFKNSTVIILFSTMALFHLSNAAMLPLLSQHLSIRNEERGILFTAICIVVAQVCMVLTAALCEIFLPRIGKKLILTIGISVIPIRGIIIIALLGKEVNVAALITTQILDGVAGGITGVLSILLVEDLTRGTGRFSMAVGTIKTMESLGASFSHLFAEGLADYYGYDAAFCFLSIVGLFPMLLYWIHMPETLESVVVTSVSTSSSSSSSLSSSRTRNRNIGGCRGGGGGGDLDFSESQHSIYTTNSNLDVSTSVILSRDTHR